MSCDLVLVFRTLLTLTLSLLRIAKRVMNTFLSKQKQLADKLGGLLTRSFRWGSLEITKYKFDDGFHFKPFVSAAGPSIRAIYIRSWRCCQILPGCWELHLKLSSEQARSRCDSITWSSKIAVSYTRPAARMSAVGGSIFAVTLAKIFFRTPNDSENRG